MYLLMTLALAQSSPRPTALEVLKVEADTPCPTLPASHAPGVLRTNIGVVRRKEDGTYAYGCPSIWGGDPEAKVAVSPDGATWMIVSAGGTWVSDNEGCTARQVPLPEGFAATEVMYWRDAPWVLAEGQGQGRLLRWDGEAFLDVALWSDFVPDGMVPDGADKLWLAGAGPTAQVRRLSLQGGLSGDVALTGLPSDVRDLERLVPVAASEGQVWLRAERYSERWLWSGLVSGETVSFVDGGQRWKSVLGPVLLEDRWWMIADQELHRAGMGLTDWWPTGSKPGWTCMQRVGEQVFACTVPAMLGVIGIGPKGTVNTAEVFTLDMVGRAEEGCGQASVCDADWAEYGGVAGITEADEPAICPDGTTASDLEAGACGCAQAAPGWAAGALLLASWRRRAPLTRAGRAP